MTTNRARKTTAPAATPAATPITAPVTIGGQTFNVTEGITAYIHKAEGSAHLRVLITSVKLKTASIVYVDARGDEHTSGAVAKFRARVANAPLVQSTTAPSASRGAKGTGGILIGW